MQPFACHTPALPNQRPPASMTAEPVYLGRILGKAGLARAGLAPRLTVRKSTTVREVGMERKWWTLVAVCVATFMLLLDITIVNVALPAIQRSTAAGFDQLQWVVDAYSLALAGLLLAAGSLADELGRRL